MTLDELLLDTASQPVLRLYSWSHPTLSLGFSQRSWDTPEVEVVRRPTGGRALLHDQEITYAVVLPEGQGSVAQNYERITGWLADGLSRLGIDLQPAPASRSSKGHPGCYNLQQKGELLLGGCKLIGSAQARRGSRILQHGAIPLRVDAARLERLMPGHVAYRGLEEPGFSLNPEDLARVLLGHADPTPWTAQELEVAEELRGQHARHRSALGLGA